MYDNIHEKIKSLAKGITAIGSGISVCMGFLGIAFIAKYDYDDFDAYLFILVFICLGIFASLVSSWLLYGYGEIIEKLTLIAKGDSSNKPVITASVKKQPTVKVTAKEVEEVSVDIEDENNYVSVSCPKCLKPLSFLKGTKEATCPFCDNQIKIR